MFLLLTPVVEVPLLMRAGDGKGLRFPSAMAKSAGVAG